MDEMVMTRPTKKQIVKPYRRCLNVSDGHAESISSSRAEGRSPARCARSGPGAAAISGP